MLFLALALAVLSLALPGSAQAAGGEPGSSGVSAFTSGSATTAVAPLVTPNPPTVETKAASAVGQTSATLNATVNPNGGEVTKCEFEYGTTTAFGSTAACTPLPGSGSSPVDVSAPVTGLAVNTPYYFRISATNAGGTSEGSGEDFITQANPPTVVLAAASEVAQTTATLNGTVNPNGETISSCKFEYGTMGTYKSSAPCVPSSLSGSSPIAVSAHVAGLATDTAYVVRIVATSAGGKGEGLGQGFKTLPNPPTVVTTAASALAQTMATLNGTVNPNGGEVTKCEFEYGTTTSYGSTAACTSLPGSGSSPVAVSASVTGLAANTTYHFRIAATNAGGTRMGSDEAFTTPPAPLAPTVLTRGATSVTETAATLDATVNPNAREVKECKFEYGTTTSYGSTAVCTSLPGSGSSPVAVSASVTGLAANTTYHFRIAATSVGGTSKGADETFATSAPPPSPPPPPPTVTTGTTSGLPAPVLGRTANVARVAGQVLVRLPGTRGFVTLSSPRQIPYGTVVEATHGELSVTAATTTGGTQKGAFFDGEFVLSQATSGRVLATLAGGNFTVCRPQAGTARAKSKPRGKFAAATHLVRRLWAEGHGNFSTRARYAGSVVAGAQWLTEDMCDGSLVLATRERVEVTDLVRHRSKVLITGGIYVSKPR